MATAADSSSSSYSPRFRRNRHSVSPVWSHVVRGERERSPAAAVRSSPSPPSPTASVPPPEHSDRSPLKTAVSDDLAESGPADAAGAPAPPSSDGMDEGGSADPSALSREKKSVWIRPSNGVPEAGAVMGAVSWPALSEATKPPSKSSSYESLKGLSNGSIPASSPAPATTSFPPKPSPDNTNSSSSANLAAPTRQKSMKRGGGSSTDSPITNNSGAAIANGEPVPPKLPQTSPQMSHNTSDKLVNSEPSPRELTSRRGNWDHGSRGGGFSLQSHGGNEHQKSYGGSRRGSNSGAGGGQHHNNFSNRPDQDRGGHDWNRRSFGSGRDAQMQQQHQQQPRAMSRPFLRPPPHVSPTFVAPPPPVHPFANPIGYHDIPSPVFYVPPPPPESFGGMPFVAPPGMFFAQQDMQLRAMLLKQIDYYFSSENLCKDVYLRQNMDEEGWVPISLIAGFNRVRNLTNNIQLILETVSTSTIVEVQGDKIRRRNDWKNWPPLTSAPNSPRSSTMPNYDTLAARLTHIRMEEGITGKNSVRGMAHSEMVFNRSSSGDLNSQLQVQASTGGRPWQNGSDCSVFARSLARSDTF